MGRTKWAFAASTAAIAVAMSGDVGMADCVTCERGPATGLGAPACLGPIFGTEPGCCEFSPTACDNAWDGFCQEKLKWKQFWHKVGTGYWVSSRARFPTCAGIPVMVGASPRNTEVPCQPPLGDPLDGVPGPIRLPPVDDGRPRRPEEPIPEFGPPPIPESNNVPSLLPEPATPGTSQGGQAKVPWGFSR